MKKHLGFAAAVVMLALFMSVCGETDVKAATAAVATPTYEDVFNLQYSQALIVQQEMLQRQQQAFRQQFMLASTMQMQNATYTSLVKGTGLDYQDMLLKDYSQKQQKVLKSFQAYNGLIPPAK